MAADLIHEDAPETAWARYQERCPSAAQLPLMTSLAQHSRHLGLGVGVIAARLGVCHSAVSRWEYGHMSPGWAHAVAYAGLARRRIVVWDGDRALAEGLDLPAGLAHVRRAVGLTQRLVASHLHLTRTAVTMFEQRSGGHHLSSIDRYVTVGLGLRLTHLGVPDGS